MQSRKRLSPNLKIYSTKQKPRGRAGKRSPMQLVALRMADLAILFRSRYGYELPNDDAGRDDLVVALNHLACLAHPRGHIANWIEIWAPWLTAAEQRDIVAPILANPTRWKADALAWRLRLTMEQRTMLGITTIGAIDMNKGARTKRRNQRDRERKAKQRRAKGIKPRKAYEAQSISRQKPWEAEGISRRTWYRRQSALVPHGTGPATA
jgi:hypothetical protein